MRESDIERFWKFVRVGRPDECWEWTGYVTPKGYGRIYFGDKAERSHRVSYAIANRVPLETIDDCVLHRCDNPKCVNPLHLFRGAAADNTADMMRKGRNSPPPHRLGEAHHNAKFDQETHRRILIDRRPARVIANELEVSERTIYRHRRGETWQSAR